MATTQVRVQDPSDQDASTRERVLALIASEGPVSAASLAADLGLTSAGVRRHLACLEEDGLIVVHDAGVHGPGKAQRGRPARRYVATRQGQSRMAGEYPELASAALRFLRDHVGPEAVETFAAERFAGMAERYREGVDAPDVAGRVEQLAALLASDGYAASVRPVGLPGASVRLVQLCQGHCPVQQIAAEFPELCEAEAQVFTELLGTHTQRLATLAAGGHVCTTNVPVVAPATTAPRPATGTPAGRTSEHVTPPHAEGSR
ncbi:helix-turn-helix transcriptional regulator [Luteimicrobium sp. NPDC057192]|uniref:helix-turn-helix transcriptional regulator n=1 Tax=Luteimicrobium sp. NPDC057192 TaxID=3346042 RepID=UPI0036449338